jgi:hypothetical protein
MKQILFFFVFLLATTLSVKGQTNTSQKIKTTKNNTIMNTDNLTNNTVKSAIDALQSADASTWYALFTTGPELHDDGHKMNFKNFFDKALGHERFTSIDKVENNGLDIYGKFHSDQWGDFKTYFKFYINPEGKIFRLEIGQANY